MLSESLSNFIDADVFKRQWLNRTRAQIRLSTIEKRLKCITPVNE